MRPVFRAVYQTCLNGRTQDHVAMGRQIVTVPDRVFPEPPLPQPLFAGAQTQRTDVCGRGHAAGKEALEHTDAPGKVRILRWQCPERVDHVGQHHDLVDLERVGGAGLAGGLTQRLDPAHKQIVPAPRRAQREEIGVTGQI